MTTNDKVLGWIDYYANRNPETFKKGLERSGQYLPMFRKIFAEAGLPRDLVYFAHIESAYKTTAYSRARAKGIFQFISATGRRYGLRIDYWVDERSDPEKS
ncbi:MAG: transglycosylase SLT domain-containing protein, partial [Acidobacteria bacterium]|nr:transglycosylase SLT domain-containing protein [Acidobacteriota bacterium]NIQ86379.1 transglycosylase SLT domain-containing protein [Acidobacteriota bacterium]